MDSVYLWLFAFLAGFVDSIVGGGGLIQLPALFLFSPLDSARSLGTIMGTNKLAAICGTSVAAWQYSRRVPIPWSSIFPTAIAAFIFSFLGARLVSGLSAEVLKPVILVLMIVVSLYTYFQKSLGEKHQPRFKGRQEQLWGIAAGCAIGFYDGFFGPGTGSFLIFVFVGWFGFDFLGASASAKVVNVATNLSAVLFFAFTGQIAYEIALPMGLCNILGSMAGTRLAILKGNKFVRLFFLLVVGALILKFGWEMMR